MRFRRLLADDDAVSPVIGVILMVAITVILAATIGAFVMDFDGPSNAPQADWQTSEEYNATGDVNAVEFEHDGGDPVETDNLVVVVDGDRTPASSGDVLQTGETLRVEFSNTSSAVSEGTSVQLVWADGRDHVLREHELTAGSSSETVDSVSVS